MAADAALRCKDKLAVISPKGQVKARMDFNRSPETQLAREFQVALSQDPALRAEHNKAIKTANTFETWLKYAPKYGTESNLDPGDIQVAFNDYLATGQVPNEVLTTLAQDIEQIRVQLTEDVDGGELGG